MIDVAVCKCCGKAYAPYELENGFCYMCEDSEEPAKIEWEEADEDV